MMVAVYAAVNSTQYTELKNSTDPILHRKSVNEVRATVHGKRLAEIIPTFPDACNSCGTSLEDGVAKMFFTLNNSQKKMLRTTGWYSVINNLPYMGKVVILCVAYGGCPDISSRPRISHTYSCMYCRQYASVPQPFIHTRVLRRTQTPGEIPGTVTCPLDKIDTCWFEVARWLQFLHTLQST